MSRPIPHSLAPALDLAARGIPVFPCLNRPGEPGDKAPGCPGGFKSATTDMDQVRAWFADGTALIGMPTGAVSNLDVLDIDTRKGGDTWLTEHLSKLPPTRSYRTQSGGLHFVFQAREGLRCTAGAIAEGIDTRCNGGYVIAWDAHGYTVERDLPPAAWPEWLITEIANKQPSGSSGQTVPEERRRPPSAQAVVDLLDRMPNGYEVPRDTYVAVMSAANGCITALLDPTPEEAGAIADAAIDWAMRYGGRDDEGQRWIDDWSKREGTLAGWQTLTRVACELIPGYAEELEAEEREQIRELFSAPIEPLPAVAGDNTPPLIHAYGENPYGNRSWLVHSVLPETGVALLSGQWGIGKTFAAVELAACAMFGTPFAGHTIDRKCGVLWLAAEGEAEISDRLQAAIEARPDVAGLSVPFVWADTFPLLLAHDAVRQFERIIKAARARLGQLGATLGLVVLDTIAAGAGWDNENDAAEGQRAMNMLRGIARHCGCLVVAIDHYGKNTESGTRGTTAKEAAADAVLALLGDRKHSGKMETRRMALRKVRGGAAGAEHPFDLHRVKIGVDDQLRDVTTCIVRWREDKADVTTAAEEAKPAQPKPASLRWHDALQGLLGGGDSLASLLEDDKTTTVEAWLAEGVRLGLTEAVEEDDSRSTKEAKRKRFANAKSDLVVCGWIVCDGNIVRRGQGPR